MIFHRESCGGRIVVALLGSGLCWITGCLNHPTSEPPVYPELSLTADDRIMVLAPHPDDEVLGCGGVIQQALAMKLPVQVVFLTYGDNNELAFMIERKRPVLLPHEVQQMGELRHGEALKAGAVLGLSPQQLVFLGYPDFGTLHIWLSYWSTKEPFRSMLTRVTQVPYPDAFRPGAAYRAEDILGDLTALLRQFKPTKVFTSHPADHNPDHIALYLFTQIAFWNLEQEMKPQMYPYLVHYPHWPTPRDWNPGRGFVPPAQLDDQVEWRVFPLHQESVLKKRQAIEAHHSQYAYGAKFLLSFICGNELFGAFPVVRVSDLTRQEAHRMDEEDAAPSMPDGLTQEEKDNYVFITRRFVRYEHDQIVITLRFSRPLMEFVLASVFCFGYRSDQSFALMPKLHINVGANHYECFDQRQQLPMHAVTLERRLNVITLRIPLKTLGDPRKVLMSAHTHRGEVPMDFVSWRVLELR